MSTSHHSHPNPPTPRHKRKPKNDNEEGLSEIELKNKLFESMKAKGIIESMKSQLRNKLVIEFNSNIADIKTAPINDLKSRSNLALNTVNSLIINYLKSNEYDYTLSVFLPECGINLSEAYPINDIFQILKISPHSKLYTELDDSNNIKSRGLLWHLVNYFCSHYVTNDASCQTETEGHLKAVSALDYKLRALEKHYSDRYDKLNISGSMSIEEKIMSYQKRLDEKAKTELEEKLKEFKENELKSYKLELNEKYRIELENLKRDYDQSYQARVTSLMAKEKNIDELIKQKYDIEQRELFMQRQHILDELKMLKEREADFKRQSELQTRSFESDLAKFKKFEEDFKKREFQLKLLENEYEQKLRNEREKIKFDLERSYAQREFLLQSIENKNKEETKRLEMEKTHLDKIKRELQANQIKVNELELELQKSRAESLSLLNENNLLKDKLSQCLNYDIIKEENNYLKAQLETIKIHLGDNYLKKHGQIKQISKTTGGNKSAFKPVQRKRSVTFASSKEADLNDISSINQNDSTILQESIVNGNYGSMNGKDDDNAAFEFGDRLLTIADNQLLIEQKLEEHNMNNNKLHDMYEMQIYEAKQMQNELADVKTNLKFLQHGIVLPDDDNLTAANVLISKNANQMQQNEIINGNLMLESVAFLESTKERLKNLENEAEKVERNYRDYQYRVTSMAYPIQDDFLQNNNTNYLKYNLNAGNSGLSSNKQKDNLVNIDDLLAKALNLNNEKNDEKFSLSDRIETESKNKEILKQLNDELNEFKEFSKKNSLVKQDSFKNTRKIDNNLDESATDINRSSYLSRDESTHKSPIKQIEQQQEFKSKSPIQPTQFEVQANALNREKTVLFAKHDESDNDEKTKTLTKAAEKPSLIIQSNTKSPSPVATNSSKQFKSKIFENSESSSSSDDEKNKNSSKNSFDAQAYMSQLKQTANQLIKNSYEPKTNDNQKAHIVYETESEDSAANNRIERHKEKSSDEDDFNF